MLTKEVSKRCISDPYDAPEQSRLTRYHVHFAGIYLHLHHLSFSFWDNEAIKNTTITANPLTCFVGFSLLIIRGGIQNNPSQGKTNYKFRIFIRKPLKAFPSFRVSL